MTVVLPSVSTAGRLRMIAGARHAAHADGKHDRHRRRQPSGIAPTASATAAINISSGFSPPKPDGKRHYREADDKPEQELAKCSDLARQRRLEAHRLGDQPGNSAGFGLVAGGPNNTFALTKGRQRAGKARLRRSARIVERKRVAMFVDGDRLTGERGLVDLQVAHGCRRRSAGTRSPDSISTMSPGTSRCDEIRRRCPSRRTVISVKISCERASMACSALLSWI